MKTLMSLMALALCVVMPVMAAGDRVVAVVNDQVITMNQLNARTELAIRQAGLKPNEAQREGLKKRTLSILIDEELQKQFAATSRLQLDKEEIAKAKDAAVEAMGVGGWSALTKGLEGAAQDKLTAEVRWQRILTRNVRPMVNVSTADADRLIEELSKSRHVLEREISMIMLNPQEGSKDEEMVKKLNEIRERVTKGASFAEEAKAYSEDKSAVDGGSLGWFSGGELNPALEDALDKMQPGDVSQPIRTPLGWHLVKLENVRTTKPVESTAPVTQYELYMLAAAATSDTKVNEEINKKLDSAASALKTPADVKAYFANKQFGDSFPESAALGFVSTTDLQETISTAIKDVKPGQWSKAVNVGPTLARIYVAGSQQALPRNLNAYREKVMDNLGAQRTELAARRFMRELRQRAFVDVRL